MHTVTTFELLISENDGLQGASGPAIPIVQEGTRAENVIKIQKRGYTAFAYNVLLNVQLLSESQGKARHKAVNRMNRGLIDS